MLLSDVKNGKQAQGKGDLLKYLEGAKITPLRAIKAKCYECTSGYEDGKVDCGVPDCPSHPFMPYRNKGITCGSEEISPTKEPETKT
jgi:hypothetical protein